MFGVQLQPRASSLNVKHQHAPPGMASLQFPQLCPSHSPLLVPHTASSANRAIVDLRDYKEQKPGAPSSLAGKENFIMIGRGLNCLNQSQCRVGRSALVGLCWCWAGWTPAKASSYCLVRRTFWKTGECSKASGFAPGKPESGPRASC